MPKCLFLRNHPFFYVKMVICRLYSHLKILVYVASLSYMYSFDQIPMQQNYCEEVNISFERVLDSVLDVVCVFDTEGQFVHVNQASLSLLGYHPHELVGHSYKDFIVPEDLEKTEYCTKRILDGCHTTNYENRYYRKDGSIVYLSWSGKWDPQDQLVYCVARDASEKVEKEKLRMQYEQEIERRNAEMQEMLERITDGFHAFDRNWNITYWNKVAESILGKPREEVLGKNLWECYPDVVGSLAYQQYHKAMEEQVYTHFEYYYPILDIWFEVSAYPSENGLSVFFRDVTKRRKIEEELCNLSLIVKETQCQVVILNADHTIIWVNEAFTDFTGYSFDEAAGKIPSELLAGPETDPQLIHYVNEQLCKKKPFRYEIINYTKEGRMFWIEKTCQPIVDENGVLQKYFVIGTDITERKKTEEELRKLSYVTQLSHNIVVISSPDRKITWVNEAFTRITGYNFEEVIGKKVEEVFDGPDTDPETIAYVKEKVTRREAFQIEVLNYKKSGETYWAEVSCQPILDECSEVQYFFSIATDITERKKAQEEVRKLSLIVKETINLVLMADAQGRITWVNNAFVLKSGYSLEEAVGRRPADLLWGPETDPDTNRLILEQTHSRDFIHAEILNYTKAGEKFWVEFHAQPVYDEKGKVTQYFGIGTDITERKQLQEQLLQEQKNRQQMITTAAIKAQENERALVGRELHDNVNQVLTTVKLYQELCLNGMDNSEVLIRKSIDLLMHSINEIRSLSKQLSAPSLSDIKLKDSVMELIERINFTNKVGITLCATSLDELNVDKDLHLVIYRILQEHLTNILKHANAYNVSICFDILDDNLVLKVTDDGKGFDTKKKSSGIGILNMTSRAESLKGSLTINSAPGLGCVLLVRLPLTW